MTETTAIILSIIGTGLTATGVAVTVMVFGWTNISKRLDGLANRLDRVDARIDETNKRIDTIGRDIAELRDRTGTLEGTLSTFMNAGRTPNAAA